MLTTFTVSKTGDSSNKKNLCSSCVSKNKTISQASVLFFTETEIIAAVAQFAARWYMSFFARFQPKWEDSTP